MADITKCFDCEKYCSDYKMCYRFTAKDNLYYQSYCEFHHKKNHKIVPLTPKNYPDSHTIYVSLTSNEPHSLNIHFPKNNKVEDISLPFLQTFLQTHLE